MSMAEILNLILGLATILTLCYTWHREIVKEIGSQWETRSLNAILSITKELEENSNKVRKTETKRGIRDIKYFMNSIIERANNKKMISKK